LLLQVTSTSLRTTSAPDGTQLDRGVQAVRDGQLADWGALERILYDALYMQVGTLSRLLFSYTTSREDTMPAWMLTSASCICCLQLGWEVGEEGNLLIAEPLCTPRVRSESSQSSKAS
jgi:hypothetical protein